MVSRLTKTAAAAGGLLALWIGWGAYSNRNADEIPYETVEQIDGVEIRQYPLSVLVETTAPSQGVAFRRLFDYISGANEASEDVSMTTPVATRGEKIEMTAPVRTLGSETVSMTAPVATRSEDGDGSTMAFYLPPEYTPSSAPTPTNPNVRLVIEPARTVATKRFSWYATEDRVERAREALLSVLEEHDIERQDEPIVLQYNDPWTPPFMRRNEIAVTVADEWSEA